MSGLLGNLVTTGANGAASKILETASNHTLLESATANAQKLEIDTQNSILDGKMDSASKELNSGHNAAKAIQF